MKRVILLLGPNGVGKSTAAGELLKILPRSAYIESDALRRINIAIPSAVALQKANIFAVTRNFLSADEIENIIFPYGLHGHRKEMLADLLGELGAEFAFAVKTFVLTCSEGENIRRMELDNRGAERIERALTNTRGIYDSVDGDKIDTTELTPAQTAERLFNNLITDQAPF